MCVSVYRPQRTRERLSRKRTCVINLVDSNARTNTHSHARALFTEILRTIFFVNFFRSENAFEADAYSMDHVGSPPSGISRNPPPSATRNSTTTTTEIFFSPFFSPRAAITESSYTHNARTINVLRVIGARASVRSLGIVDGRMDGRAGGVAEGAKIAFATNNIPREDLAAARE